MLIFYVYIKILLIIFYKTLIVLYFTDVDDCSESDEEKSDGEEINSQEVDQVLDQVNSASEPQPVAPIMAPVIAPLYKAQLAVKENGELYWIYTRAGLARLTTRKFQGRLNRPGTS